MSVEIPLVITAVPGAARIATEGMPGIGVQVFGVESSQDDANGPHAVMTTQAATGTGAYVQTDPCVTTQMLPDLTFRITTAADIADLALWVGLFRVRPGEAATFDAECAAVRYDTSADGTAFWRAISIDAAGVTESTTGSVAIAISTEYLIRISASGSSVAFYVNGTLIATHSGNIPTSTTLLRVGCYLSPLADTAKSFAFGYIRAGQIDHGQTGGLTDDDHAQYALLAGRASSQTLKGGTASGETLTLESTAHATKGGVRLAAGEWQRFPEVAAPATPAAGNVNVYAKADGLMYAMDDAGVETKLSNVAGGTGDVVGPATATDNALARYDGATGELLQDSALIVDDTGNASGLATLTLPNAGLHLLDTNASHDLIVTPGSDLTADRVLTITTGDAARTLDISAASVTVSSFGATLTDDADASTARTTLGLVIGTDVQAYDAELAAIAGLTSAADKGIQFTGAGTAAVFDLTAAGKALLDDANAAAQRATLSAAALGANGDITSMTGITGAIKAPTQIEDTNGNELVKFTTTASAVNELTVANAATGDKPAVSATGGDTNIGMTFLAKGTGGLSFRADSLTLVDVSLGSAEIATWAGVASAVNRLATANAATGSPPTITATGTDADIGIRLVPKGAGTVQVNNRDVYYATGTDVALADGGTGASLADPGADRLMFWDDSAGAVDWLTVSGATFSGTTLTVTPQSGRYLGTTVVTAGTTTFTTGASTASIRVRAWAAGGAGGGAASAGSSGAAGGGGSAGGYFEWQVAVSPSTGYTVAVGTGGTAGAAGNNPGNAGGNTTIQIGATTATANGGLGGQGMAAGATPLSALGGASPAVSTNGTVNAYGAPGGYAFRASAAVNASGAGGASLWGGAGNSRITQGTGNTATGYGSGGGGGSCVSAGGNVAGGAGADGLLVIEEFS